MVEYQDVLNLAFCFMKKVLITIFLLFGLFWGVGKLHAEEEIILFWGVNCPYCHVVREKLDNEKLRERVEIKEIEIQKETKNLSLFKEKAEVCGIDLEKAGVPMLFLNGKCYQGVDSIMAKVRYVAGESSVEKAQEDPAPVEKENKSVGKANTEKLIWIVSGFLVLLPIFGYFVKSKRGKEASIIASLLLLPLFFATPTYAICPLCTVAVGAGVGFSRSLGIDDSIVGVWIGGLLVSSSMWLIEWLKKKKIIKEKGEVFWTLGIFLGMYALVIVPLKLGGIIGHPFNVLLGIDKVLLGIIIGSVLFFTMGRLHFFLTKKNSDKVYFPYQKVVIPVGALLLATIILYFIVY